jgi:hypothetical protein
MEPRASCMLCQCSSTELHTQPLQQCHKIIHYDPTDGETKAQRGQMAHGEPGSDPKQSNGTPSYS